MTNSRKTLYYIYKNRWQRAVYGDASKGWIMLILYVLALLFIGKSESKYLIYLLLAILFAQTISLHTDRKDLHLLSRFYENRRLKLLVFTDYLLLNLPVLLLILLKDMRLFVASFLFIFLISLTKISFQNKLTYLLLSNYDPLWKTYIRKYPFMLLVFTASYYVHFQGIINENYNLSVGSYLVIPFVGAFSVNGERDKLVFIKQSKLTESEFLANLIKANIFNTFLFLIPHIIMDLYKLHFEIPCILFILFFTVGTVCLRFIFFHNLLGYSLVSMLFFGIGFGLLFDKEHNDLLLIVVFFLVDILFFALARKAVKKLK